MKNRQKNRKGSRFIRLPFGVPPVGIEPTHMAPEAIALSTELRGHF